MNNNSGIIQTALITGGNGNLGNLVGNKLLAKGIKVVKLDLPGTEPDQIQPGEEIVTGDIRDSELLTSTIQTHRPDTIFHLASLLSGSSESDLVVAWEINATASFNLMRIAIDQDVGRFFFASTVATYGDVDQEPMSEKFAQWPENLYGATKVAVERLGVYFKVKHGLDFRCLRFPLVVSPYAPKTAVSAFPSHAFKAAVQGKEFIFPVSKETGVSTIFLDDVVDSIVQYTFTEEAKLTRHVYNLHSFYLSAEMLVAELAKQYPEFRYQFHPVEAVENLISSWPDTIDDAAARTDWGWNPGYNFSRAAERMFELLVR